LDNIEGNVNVKEMKWFSKVTQKKHQISLKNGSNAFANFFSKLSSKLLLTISAIFRKSYKRFFE
jgi:hypothetical protein